MNNEIENDNSVDSASIEVKEGLFSRIKNSFQRKALPSGETKTQTTNISMESLMKFANIRAGLTNALEKIQASIQNIISSNAKDSTPINTPHVIGKDDKNITNENQEKTTEQFTPHIPTNVQVHSQIKQPIIPKGIIDNAKSAKDVAQEEPTSTLEVADISVDETMLDKKEPTKVSDTPTLQVVDINVDPTQNQIQQTSVGKDLKNGQKQNTTKSSRSTDDETSR